MGDFREATWIALGLLARFDVTLGSIVGLSLAVSLAAVVIAACVGLPAGVALAICRFKSRRIIVLLVNALLGLPPVVVGLATYLMLSPAGPLGRFGLL